jgi:hypothetical protein
MMTISDSTAVTTINNNNATYYDISESCGRMMGRDEPEKHCGEASQSPACGGRRSFFPIKEVQVPIDGVRSYGYGRSFLPGDDDDRKRLRIVTRVVVSPAECIQGK